MSYQTNDSNRYQVGTMILAKDAPNVMLHIRKYYQRIYYCCIAGSESAKQKVYFEKELITPGNEAYAQFS